MVNRGSDLINRRGGGFREAEVEAGVSGIRDGDNISTVFTGFGF